MSNEQSVALPSCSVRGVVIDDTGALRTSPVLVRAFDRELRREVQLGEARTDARGRYAIRYSPAQLARPGKAAADLLVRAYNADGKLLVASPVIFNAGPAEVVDLVQREAAAPPRSELERHRALLAPLLSEVELATLTEDEIAFSAAKLQLPPRYVGLLAIAHQLAATTKVDADVFYALFRAGLPTRLPALLLQPTDRIRRGLAWAVDNQIVGASVGKDADRIVHALQALIATHIVEAKDNADGSSLRRLLAASGATPAEQAAFLGHFVDHAGDPAALWAAARADRRIAPAAVESIELAVQVGLLAPDSTRLADALLARRRAGTLHGIRDLVALTTKDWAALIRESRTEIPARFTGDDKVTAFAEELRETLRMAFPTKAIANALASSKRLSTAARTDLQRFFANTPAFELAETRIRTLLDDEQGHAFAGVVDRAALVQELQRVQRVQRVAAQPEHVEALLEAGLDSAYGIANVPAATFIDEHKDRLGGETRARTYHANASRLSAATNALGTSVYLSLHQQWHFEKADDHATGTIAPDLLKKIPSLEELFGSLDSCDCEHCRSVYGPASYLVDVLQFLHKSGSPYTKLVARRPDIPYIDLTCANSDTPLPLIDLANEILEFYVEHGSFDELDTSHKRQLAKNTRDITPEELSLNPQYSYDHAYVTLAAAVRAPTLPYHRWLETIRAYLGLLGTTRAELVETIQSVGVAAANDPDGPIDRTQHKPTSARLAREILKMSALEVAIVTGTDDHPARELYGYSGGTWRSKVAVAETLIRKLGITYVELIGLLDTRFINPTLVGISDRRIVAFSLDASCDLSKTYIQYTNSDHAHLEATGLETEDWSRLQRFTRLWRKLGWTIVEVDAALAALVAPAVRSEITETVIERLAAIERLRLALDVPVMELLPLWAQIDTFGEASLYDRLFRNRTVLNPVDPAFALAANKRSLATTAPLVDHQATVLAGLRISATELAMMAGAGGIAEDGLPELTLDTLGALYRHARLARAVGLSIGELLDLIELTAIDPFVPHDPRSTPALVAAAAAIAASSFAIPEIAYIFRAAARTGPVLAPTADVIVALLLQLQDALRVIVEQTQQLPDPNGDLLRAKLVMVVDPSKLADTIALIEGESTMIDADQLTFIADNLPFLDGAAALRLVGPQALSAPEERRAFVLPWLLRYLRDSSSRGTIIQTLAEPLGVEADLLGFLLERVMPSQTFPGDPAKHALDDYRALVGNGVTARFYAETSGFDDATPALATRVDPTINFFWDESAPDPQVPGQTFGARWSGHVVPTKDETYTFYLRASDGARLTIGVGPTSSPPLITIDAWADSTEHIAMLPMTSETAYWMVLDYHREGPGALVELSWSSLSTPRAIIPESQLFASGFTPPTSLVQPYQLLHRIAMLFTRFAIDREEAEYLVAHAADFGGFAIDELAAGTSDAWGAWNSLRAYVELRDRLPAGEQDLLDVFRATIASGHAAGVEVLAEIAGWSAADAGALARQLALRDEDMRNASGPTRLGGGVRLADRLGVSVPQLIDWGTTGGDKDQAEDMIRTAKSRFDDASWQVAAKPLNDELRNRRRDALVTYVLSDPALPSTIVDADSLFEYFLIDVNMDACMMTSRIKQAMSSVQLFVQRCFMNLEPNVPPTRLDAGRWAWMKNYRVWEANRKIFLYPENWIEPELRSNKTPFFEELESQLQQEQLTDTTVEAAITAYLRKVDDVSRLEMSGLYWYRGDWTRRGAALHLFGRTKNLPHTYFYRQLDLDSERWTPWEQVPLDIDGDHLIPVMFHRRLYLFWLTFEEKADQDQNLDGPDVPQPPDTSEVDLASARYDTEGATITTWKTFFNETLKDVNGLEQGDMSVRENGHIQGALLAYYEENDPDIDSWNDKYPDRINPPPPDEPPKKVVKRKTRTAKHLEIKLSWAEYKDGAWGNKQKAEAVICSYPHDSGDPVPPIADHYFEVSTTGELLISAYRRRPDVSAHPDLDKTFHIGSFALDDCRAEMKRFQGDVSPAARANAGLLGEYKHTVDTPRGTELSYMGYRERSGNNELTIRRPGFTTTFQILTATPGNYFLLPPTEKLASPTSIGQVVYPFAYEDQRRVYVASVNKPVIRNRQSTHDEPAVESEFLISEDVMLSRLEDRDTDGTGGFVITNRDLDLGVDVGVDVDAQMPDLEVDTTDSDRGVALDVEDKVRFRTMFHPHICTWIEDIERGGVPALLTLANQQLSTDAGAEARFHQVYKPTDLVDSLHYPRENVDFGAGAYAAYNWELFFHIPLLIAGALSRDQQFEAAQKWFHYIFDPTASKGTLASYWKFLPFHQNATLASTSTIFDLLQSLGTGGDSAMRTRVLEQIEEWRDNPFDPHLIAALRITAYQKTVVIKYVQNLIAWGDQLFARDTIESINEATQLYVLASHILGRRPQKAPPRGESSAMSYDELRTHLDAFSNAMVKLENEFPFTNLDDASPSYADTGAGYGVSSTFYFCIPANDDLVALWDTVADRLFKIRHCMTLEGVTRQLPLFEPPIDPALLVRATALGLDLGGILNDVNAPLGPYRFTVVLQKANELCSEVRALGAAILSALEKKDGEALALLRATQEVSLLQAVKALKEQQIEEAAANVLALEATREVTQQKQVYYQTLLSAGLTSYETTQLRQLGIANSKTQQAIAYEQMAQAAAQIPNATAGASGWSSPVVTAQFGGSNLSAALSAYGKYVAGQGTTAAYFANQSAIMGGHGRRTEDWVQQVDIATKELAQIDKQIAASNIRVAIAQADLDNQQLQVDHSGEVAEVLRSKYTDQELYGWMQAKLASVYFDAYSLAYGLAKKAERAFRFELGLVSSNQVQFGYWDSLHKGLLAGERLALALKHMEAEYYEQNRRELEIAKEISLRQLDPRELLALRETGACEIELPETLFDGDYPGHYMRRLKTVSLSIPCVVGPYTSVNCTLTLLANRVRTDPNAQRPYPEDTDNPDPRFTATFGAMQSIATSHAINDGGLFEVNFRDERYLPFEGAGAISRWRLEMPRDCNTFDFRTIADVVMHVRYTARDGGVPLRRLAKAARVSELGRPDGALPLGRLFSARHELPNEWHRFLHPADDVADLTLALDLGQLRFPYPYRDTVTTPRKNRIHFVGIDVLVCLKESTPYTNGASGPFRFTLRMDQAIQATGELSVPSPGMSPQVRDLAVTPSAAPGAWSLTVTAADLAQLAVLNPALCRTVVIDGASRLRLNPDAIDDLLLVCHYTVK